MMALLNDSTYKAVRDAITNEGIHMDLGDFAIFRRLIDYFNRGSDDDFLVSWETIEYWNLGVTDFGEVGHFQDGEVAFIYFDNLEKFCDSVKRFYNNSLDELFIDYFEEVSG